MTLAALCVALGVLTFAAGLWVTAYDPAEQMLLLGPACMACGVAEVAAAVSLWHETQDRS